jgi:sec-independent protein translocase protein TatA
MTAPCNLVAFLQNLGMPEMVVIGIVALLLFGKRLPEVGRSLGRGIVEFKKGLRDTSDEIRESLPRQSDVIEPTKRPPARTEETQSDKDFNKP